MNVDLQEMALARLLRESFKCDPELIDDADALSERLYSSSVNSEDSSLVAIVVSIVRSDIAAQMQKLPADLPVELAAPAWLAELRELHPETDLDSLRAALAAWAFALQCDVRAALVRLADEDRELAFDAERCRTALLEVCPERPLQVNLLARAIDAGITVEMEKLPDETALVALLTDLESLLHDEHFRDGTARWTLDAWRAALGAETKPPALEETADVPWSLTTEVLASLAAGVFLMKQLFWFLWGIDSENRFWFGIESAPWAIGSAVVIGGGIGFFGGLLYSTAALFDFPSRRTSLSAVFQVGCLSTVCAVATASILVLVEQTLPALWNLPVAVLFGIVTSLIAIRFLGKGTCVLLVLAAILLWVIYWFHWIIYWEYDPESVCLVSNAPGVDAFFLFLITAAGAGPLVWTGLRDRAAWKKLPENRFQRWPQPTHTAGFRLSRGGDLTVTFDSAGAVSVAALADGVERASFAAHDAAITDIDVSPDGRLVATASHDMTACVHDAEDGTFRARLTGHWQSVTSVVWSPDGNHLATAGSDGTVRVWECDSWRSLFTINTRHDAVSALTFPAGGIVESGRLVAGRVDGTVECFAISSDSRQHSSAWTRKLPHGVTALVALPDGCVAAATSGNRVAVFDYDGRELATRDFGEADSPGVECVATIPGHDGTLLVSTHSSLLAWRFASDETDRLASPGAGAVACCHCPADLSWFSSNEQPVQRSTGCVLVATHDGSRWFLLEHSTVAQRAEDEPERVSVEAAADSGRLTLTALSEPVSPTDDFKPVDGRFEMWLRRVAERHPRGAFAVGALLLVVGVTALLRMFGSVVAVMGLISVRWLTWGSFRPMLKPHGAFTDELRKEWFELLDHGSDVGTVIGLLAAGFIGLRLVFGDRWVLAVILQDAQRGTLAAAKWLVPFLIVVSGPLIVLKSTDWFQCLTTIIWTGGPCALFLLLLGWICGGCCGAVRSSIARKRRGRTEFNHLCRPSLRQAPEAGVDGLLGLTAIASVLGMFFGVGGAVFVPVMEFAFVNLVRMDSEGTASGLGQLTVIEDGPPDAIPIETVWQAFRDDRESATAEYVDYEFVFFGNLRNRAPYFTLSSASDDSEKELAVCVLTPKHEFWATHDDYAETLYPGRRVMVVAVCEGIDDLGVVHFSKCRLLDWTFDKPEPWPATDPVTSVAKSAGGARAGD